MTFVDTNVFVYAVGGLHPLRDEARTFLEQAVAESAPLCTSAEVLQELMHLYLPVDRIGTLDAALDLVRRAIPTVWPVEAEDVQLARTLLDDHPGLSARDLIHRASCIRRGVDRVKTFDRALAAAFGA